MLKASIPWNCKQIHKMVMNNSLVFDNVIQRGFVWDRKKSSLLIDTILRDYITPAMYTIKDGRTVKTPKGDVAIFDCLDGKQRCMTVTKFRNNEFALTGLQPIMLDDGSEIELNGLTYDTLPDQLKDDFDKYTMSVYYISDATTDEIIELMARLNNGKPLTNTEISRIKAADFTGIKELADAPIFKELYSEKALNGYQDEDTVIKTHIIMTTYRSKNTNNPSAYTLDNTAVKPVFETVVFDDAEKQEILAIYDNMLSVHKYLVNNKKKRAASYMAKRTHLLSLIPVFMVAQKGQHTIEEIGDFVAAFFDGKPSIDDTYNKSCKEGSNHGENVYNRIQAVIKKYTIYNTTGSL